MLGELPLQVSEQFLSKLFNESSNICGYFFCGKNYRRIITDNIPISKKILRFIEILSKAALGDSPGLLEIGNYEANFINQSVNIKKNIFFVDHADNQLLNMVHTSLFANYIPVYQDLEFMLERRFYLKIDKSIIMIISLPNTLYQQSSFRAQLEDYCHNIKFGGKVVKSKDFKIGVVVIGKSVLGKEAEQINIEKYTVVDLVVLSEVHFTKEPEFEAFKFNKNFGKQGSCKFVILTIKYLDKETISRHFTIEMSEEQLSITMVSSYTKPLTIEVTVSPGQVITNQFVLEEVKKATARNPKEKVKLKIYHDYSNQYNLKNQTELEINLSEKLTNPSSYLYLKKSEKRDNEKINFIENLKLNEELLTSKDTAINLIENLEENIKKSNKKYKLLSKDDERRRIITTQNIEVTKKITKAYKEDKLDKTKQLLSSYKSIHN